MEGNLVTDHLARATADQCGRNVVAHRQNKHQQATSADSRNGLWPEYFKEGVLNGVAPNDCEARSCDNGIVFITLYIGNTINGSNICVIATSVPFRLYIIWIRPSSEMTPNHTIMSFSTPWVCKQTRSTTWSAPIRKSKMEATP